MELTVTEKTAFANGNPLQQAIYKFIENEINDDEFNEFLMSMFGNHMVNDPKPLHAYIRATGYLGEIEGPFNMWGMYKASENYWKFHEIIDIGKNDRGANDYFPYLQVGNTSSGEGLFLSIDNGGINSKHPDSFSEMWAENAWDIYERLFWTLPTDGIKVLHFQQLCQEQGLGKVTPCNLENHLDSLVPICIKIFDDNWDIEKFLKKSCFYNWQEQDVSIKKIIKQCTPLFKRKKLGILLLKSKTEEQFLGKKIKSPSTNMQRLKMNNLYNEIKQCKDGIEQENLISQYLDTLEPLMLIPKN